MYKLAWPLLLFASCCWAELEPPLDNASRLKQHGLKTGVVSTTELTRATLAAAYAHASDRGWDVEAECGYDIARQFLDFAHGDGVEVALAGAREVFANRFDGRNLIEEWSAKHSRGSYVSNME